MILRENRENGNLYKKTHENVLDLEGQEKMCLGPITMN